MAQSGLSQDSENDLRRQLGEVLEREAAANRRVEALERRLELIESRTGLIDPETLSDQQEARIRGRGAPGEVPDVAAQNVTPPAEATADSASGGEDEEDRKAPAPTAAVELVTQSEQGIFGNKLSFELGMQYTQFDKAQLNLSGFLALDAIFLGRLSLDSITSDVLVTDATIRYGFTDRLQVDVNIPYIFRHTNYQTGGAGGDASGLIEAGSSGSGLGDINFGVSYRVLRETVRWPDVVINVRGKAPNGRHAWGVELVEVDGSTGNLNIPARVAFGSGLWAASGGISVLKTIDPMVVFGSVTLFHNFSRHFDDLSEANFDQPGTVYLGDSIQFGAGVAYALNDRSSLTMSFTDRFFKHTSLKRDCDGCVKRQVVGSQANVGILNIGANFALNQRLAVITNVGIGMTNDAPDMLLSLRVPYRF
jgi:hypothetical protein